MIIHSIVYVSFNIVLFNLLVIYIKNKELNIILKQGKGVSSDNLRLFPSSLGGELDTEFILINKRSII